ncbi:toxin-antitoxin system YwqK family antitoxin [Fusobacterium pseudoperiodonticum]|uniref:toxin-antitoxin system YwqK family antitoxin n=1 Tax=Fusobacterium pseudoperiodonticum TaxID=2663009 RepID=UPI0028E73135|nr:toxin-antitoxin system YwqK family antitoxin [Fusobacterium pseudoperiodonticum]
MKKILILLIFLFISIFSYSTDVDFDIRVMMGLTKIEEKDNPKYKKFLNYIDENLAKKGEVKYSHKINMGRKGVEFYSEKGEILFTENLPKEFLDIVDNSIKIAENKEEIKKTIKNIYEDPYIYVTISKYRESLILFTEENIVNRGNIKKIMSVVLKRELTDDEKNDLIYLKDNNSDDFFKKYRTYLESETTKIYTNDKLELFHEIRGLTDTAILYGKNEVLKEVLEYTDASCLDAVAKEYKNDKLLKETIYKNKEIVLEKEYYYNEKLAREIPMKDGLIHGKVKTYYENGKIRSTANFLNGNIDGPLREYNQVGKLIQETLYKNGNKVKKKK